jgi:RNA-binding protein
VAALELSGRQRKFLRGLAHALAPVVQIGKSGLTDTVLAQVDRALDDHELIKVRWLGAEREAIEASAARLTDRLGCAEAGRIGHVSILYRPQSDPDKRKIHLFGA